MRSKKETGDGSYSWKEKFSYFFLGCDLHRISHGFVVFAERQLETTFPLYLRLIGSITSHGYGSKFAVLSLERCSPHLNYLPFHLEVCFVKLDVIFCSFCSAHCSWYYNSWDLLMCWSLLMYKSWHRGRILTSRSSCPLFSLVQNTLTWWCSVALLISVPSCFVKG